MLVHMRELREAVVLNRGGWKSLRDEVNVTLNTPRMFFVNLEKGKTE